MLRLFALTIDGNLFHWPNRGWEAFTGGLHQRAMEFKDAKEARQYLERTLILWPEGTVDKYIADPSTDGLCCAHEIKPFEGFYEIS